MSFKKITLSIFLIIAMELSAMGSTQKTVKFAGQWPFHPTKMIAVDAN